MKTLTWRTADVKVSLLQIESEPAELAVAPSGFEWYQVEQPQERRTSDQPSGSHP